MLLIAIINLDIYAQQLHAVYVPFEKISTIKFDGNIEEWSWVPEKYYIFSGQLAKKVFLKPEKKDNWDCKLFVAWNDITNRIYIIAVVQDNFFNIKSNVNVNNYQLNDNMVVAINAINSEGEYRIRKRKPYYEVVKCCISPSDIVSSQFNIISGPTWLENNPSFINYGISKSIEKAKKDSVVTIIYEIGMVLWKRWSELGAEYSDRYQIAYDQIIKLSIGFNDIDDNPNERVASWVTTTGFSEHWELKIDYLSQFLLDSPSPSESTWSGIYHLIKP